jgi:hypothetical protein
MELLTLENLKSAVVNGLLITPIPERKPTVRLQLAFIYMQYPHTSSPFTP